METPSTRARRVIGLAAGVLLLALASLVVAAGVLVDADRQSALVRRSLGREAAADALIDAIELAARSEASERLVVDAAFGPVDPAAPRTFLPTPQPHDEGRFLLDLVGDPDAPSTPRATLRAAAFSSDSATRLLAVARGAALELRERTGRAADWAAAAKLGVLGRTREGVFVGLIAGDGAAREEALRAVGTEDETDAAALLLGTATDDEVLSAIGRRRVRLDLQAEAAVLLADVPERTDETGARRIRVAFRTDGTAVVAARNAAAGAGPDVWHVALLSAGRVTSIARRVLPAHGARLAVATDGADVPAVALSGASGLRIVDTATAQEPAESGLAPLLLVGMALAAAASLGAFGAFARGVRRNARLETLRSEFVATVGHELRTPVAVMRTSAETLALERAKTPEDRRLLTTAIVRESERLSHLLGNVLDFARMEAGRRRFDLRPRSVAGIVRSAVDGYRAALTQAGFRVDVEIEPDLPDVRCDRTALGAALTNLLENAIKFSPDRREALVRVHRDGDQVVVEVVDHGIGVPDDEKAMVFERFRRGSAEQVRETRGTGIGLSLVRHAIEAHGGTASVHDTAGGGATFRLRLPLGDDGNTGGTA